MDAKTNGDLCAYPDPHENLVGGIGLTKRELIAAMAMQGLLSRDSTKPIDATKDAHQLFVATVARQAVAHADALLAKLAKTDAQP